MIYLRVTVWFVILLFPLSGFSAGESRKTVSGVVVDENGKGVGDIEIAPKWRYQDPRSGKLRCEVQGPEQNGQTFSNPDGTFELNMLANWWEGILGFDKDRTLAAVGTVKRDESPTDLRLVLKPLVKVNYEIVDPLPEVDIQRVGLSIYVEGPERLSHPQIIYWYAPPKGVFHLPEGNYRLQASAGTLWQMKNITFSVPGAVTTSEMGEVALEPIKWAAFPGGIPPELEFSKIRGLPDDFSLESMKGKWVLLDFWATWCGPCHRDMVKLLEFDQKYRKFSNQYEIILIHSPDAKDFTEIDEKIEDISRKYWSSQSLHFPIMLDAEGKIKSAYGVRLLPSKILINPQGKVVTQPGGQDAISQLSEMMELKLKALSR